jgi:hypothetical protein
MFSVRLFSIVVVIQLLSMDTSFAKANSVNEVFLEGLTSLAEKVLPFRVAREYLDGVAGNCVWTGTPNANRSDQQATFEFGQWYSTGSPSPSPEAQRGIRTSILQCRQFDGAELRVTVVSGKVRVRRVIGRPFLFEIEGSALIVGARLALKVVPRADSSASFELTSSSLVTLSIGLNADESFRVGLQSGELKITHLGESASISITTAPKTKVSDGDGKVIVEGGAFGGLIPSGFYPGSAPPQSSPSLPVGPPGANAPAIIPPAANQVPATVPAAVKVPTTAAPVNSVSLNTPPVASPPANKVPVILPPANKVPARVPPATRSP